MPGYLVSGRSREGGGELPGLEPPSFLKCKKMRKKEREEECELTSAEINTTYSIGEWFGSVCTY